MRRPAQLLGVALLVRRSECRDEEGRVAEERVDHLRQEILPAELSQALERARVEVGAFAFRARLTVVREWTGAGQRLRQLVRTDRLRDVVVHAGGEAGLAVLGIAFAVIAMMRGRTSAGQRSQIRRDASRPSSSGICTSMSTTS